jgi:hypothetical protein
MDHFVRDCSMANSGGSKPQRSSNQQRLAQARVYALTPSKADTEAKNADVVIGTIPLFGSLACTLFDSSATHSFVSTTYARICNMCFEPQRHNITVATPVGDSLICSKVVEDCPISIGGRVLLANFVVFKMLGYDVILGMDWLSKHQASIDCRRKEITFRSPDGEEFKYYGSQV